MRRGQGLAQRLAARTLELIDIPSESRDEARATAHVAAVLHAGSVAVRDLGDTCVLAGPEDADRARGGIRAWLDGHGLSSVGYVSDEFLAEGTAVANPCAPRPNRRGLVRSEEGDRIALLHEELGAPVVRTDVTSAEMIKYASNAFLGRKISFINEIANICERLGAVSCVEVAEEWAYDRRIGPHVPPSRPRLWGLVLPQGCLGPGPSGQRRVTTFNSCRR